MSRAYDVTFDCLNGEWVTKRGFGNTRTSAERSARRKLKAKRDRQFAVAFKFEFVPEDKR